MNTLVFGFHGEGIRDYSFTRLIVQRTLEHLLPYTDIIPLDLKIVNSDLTQEAKILSLAQMSFGYALLVCHLDADAPDTTRALEQRFKPGFDVVQALEIDVNKDIVPVIPVRMSEAWMLVDFEAFRDTVGTKLDGATLGFPDVPHRVEAIQHPKAVFEQAVRNARPSRRRRISLEDVYIPLASRINLELLAKLPAFQEFLNRLVETLIRLHYLDDH